MSKIIRIGGIDYGISAIEDLKDDEGEPGVGHISDTTLKIRIDNKLAEQAKFRVAWHEIFHGISWMTGAAFEEDVVELLAQSVLQVLRDNPCMCSKEAFAEFMEGPNNETSC